ncbi:MAG: alpha-galactosidase [Chloroflexi bacterium]|nr:alpha-galactosidase [Chloroflexota bacterium]
MIRHSDFVIRHSAQWPHPIPCRTRDGQNRDLFVMVLGDAETPIADGVFHTLQDAVKMKDGQAVADYYRTLGIRHYLPIDKSCFPLPPSGWCSWYCYYQDVDEDRIRANALWIARNLKEYGAEYVQIDDGWQGSGHGAGENRDWTTVDRRFPGGMDRLAGYIRDLGLKPGIWLAPHGQSNQEVVRRNSGVFLLMPDGSSASDTWAGKFLVDPSSLESHEYLKTLFDSLVEWGYDYFKIDGQPVVLAEYAARKSLMKNPAEDAGLLYRRTLEAVRAAIGPGRYLLGCWGTPLEGSGIMNGSRTGGDVTPAWEGFKTALQVTMRYYYLHNIVWYCDPDVMLLRPPLTLDQARAWATLQGLTGQALMASDELTSLPEDRVRILKRVFPAAGVRPLDLFPSPAFKRTWDLKINNLGRSYDVVGIFNYDEARAGSVWIRWQDLGLPEDTPVHVFDFWNDRYLGYRGTGMSLEIPASACRVVTLLPDNGEIQLISTNRHVTQGWPDLLSLQRRQEGNACAGTSRVIRNDPYKLTFVFPVGRDFMVGKATARDLPVKIDNHRGWAEVQFISPETADIDWEVIFISRDWV